MTTKKYTMSDIREMNAANGMHFFERGSMRFFDSRIESSAYNGAGGVFFITSEQFHGSQGVAPRCYTIRQFIPGTGAVETFGRFNEIRHIEDARFMARTAARNESKVAA